MDKVSAVDSWNWESSDDGPPQAFAQKILTLPPPERFVQADVTAFGRAAMGEQDPLRTPKANLCFATPKFSRDWRWKQEGVPRCHQTRGYG